MNVKKNDSVLITKGKEKGKSGRVIAAYPKTGLVLIEKLNVVKKHTKPNEQLRQGGILEVEAPLSSCNVKVICPKCSKPTAIKYTDQGDNSKARACRLCNAVIA